MPWSSELIAASSLQVVALVLEDSQGNVLLTQRPQGKHLAGYWEFPGGKVETNETLQQALQREIKEELDYQPPELKHLVTVTHQYTDKRVKIHFFHCCDPSAEPTPMEQQVMQWTHKSALSKTNLPPANFSVIDLI